MIPLFSHFSRAVLAGLLLAVTCQAADPLRVFIRAGQSNRGREVHAHPRFLEEWTRLLTERGVKVSGGLNLPTSEELAGTDVLVMYAQDGGGFPVDQRPALENFLKRGGGLVVIHTATVPTPSIPDGAAHWKSVIGGSWVQGTTKWLEGPMSLYYVDRTHPITRDVANFDLDDEIYYDMDMSPAVRVLAAAYTPHGNRRGNTRAPTPAGKINVYDIAPQMWTYENKLEAGETYRAFVSIPGHLHKTFDLPHYRAVLLRGIAWAGRRANVDEFNSAADLNTLLYPEGGPQRPKDSLAQMEIHPEFRVSLVASEPLVNKVMNIDWDAQGRLWVCETPEYPDGRHVNPATDYVQRWQGDDRLTDDGRLYDRPAHDRISILTDTNGDGVMDSKRIFADYQHGVPGGLERVSSFVLHRDGVIAAAAPDIWLLRDTNGDGTCDRAEKLFTNLGDGDTHAVINNLRWGFDGWIYATHGYSGTANVLSGDRSKGFGRIGSGVVRFRPDGSAFEQFTSKGGNTWGLQISWDNEVFWTQPTSGDLLMHTVMSEDEIARSGVARLPGFRVVSKSLKTFPPIPHDRLPYVQIDWVGFFTAAAGTVIYDGGTWPAKWNYSYFTTEPTINLVHHQFVSRDGVSFTARREPGREEQEFIGGRDYWFRPIETRIGPDGALYVVDFYNQAVIHNDTRGPKHGPRNAAIRPDRDHYYARIWRVDHREARPVAVPDLSAATPARRVAALEHSNQHVRMNAHRLLVESPNKESTGALRALATSNQSPQARVAALWTLARLGELDPATFVATAGAADPAVKKNALGAYAAMRRAVPAAAAAGGAIRASVLRLAADSDPRVQQEALRALLDFSIDESAAAELIAAYPRLQDPYLKAQFMALANSAPATFLEAAFGSAQTEAIAPLVSALTTTITSGRADEAARLVVRLADKPASQDVIKQALLQSLAGLTGPAPEWTAPLQAALQKLLNSDSPALAGAALPLAVKWDAGDKLSAEIQREVRKLETRLRDANASDTARAEVAAALLNVRSTNPAILAEVAGLLASGVSSGLQTSLVDALGGLPDAEVGPALVGALPRLSGEAQASAFNHLLKRATWSAALLDALDAGRIDFATLGPANAHRLRMHPDSTISGRAAPIIEKIRGPEAREKAALVARFTPLVQPPGDIARGRELFVANCANCHRLGNLGALVGPQLDGMGAHGPAELLGQILDPNRELDFSFSAWNFETTDGEVHDGVIARENNAVVTLRNAAGEIEIPKNQIVRRKNTGLSLMPEGFEALGEAGLRDLLAFICGDESRFRFLDLRDAFTADSRKGMYRSLEADNERLHLAKRGPVKAQGVPFLVSDHARHPKGHDVMVLRGGQGGNVLSRQLPQRVEVKVGYAARQLHFLGGVAGWGYPATQDNVPALKTTVHYADGTTEEFQTRNAVEFADYNREVEVPGSKLVRGVTSGDQLRFYTHKLKGSGVIDKIVFESANNGVAPTTVAVTADLSGDPLPSAAH